MKRIALLLSMVLVGCSRSDAPDERTPLAEVEPSETGLVQVRDRSHVCMVNDRYLAKPQIAVTVEGKTYFGCCAMCKEKLETTPGVRAASDPISGVAVDKATAIIGRDATGKVYYFESEATFARVGR